MRQKFEAEDPAEVTANKQDGKVDRMQGAARAISSFIDPSLDWKDIPWFQSITKSASVLPFSPFLSPSSPLSGYSI